VTFNFQLKCFVAVMRKLKMSQYTENPIATTMKCAELFKMQSGILMHLIL